MEYQKITNLLDNTPNKPSRFRTRNQVKINDDSHGTYNTGNLIRFKTSIIRSILVIFIRKCQEVYGNITETNQL